MSEAKQTPIIDLLRDVPADARQVYEHDSMHSQNIPFGRMASEAADTIEQQAERVRVLREALAEAIVCVQEWSAYVAPYYREKHDFDGDLKRLRDVLEASNDPVA